MRHRCLVSEMEADALLGHEAPILLLRRRRGTRRPSPTLPGGSPANPYLGVMNPYTPLHHLLMDTIGRTLRLARAAFCRVKHTLAYLAPLRTPVNGKGHIVRLSNLGFPCARSPDTCVRSTIGWPGLGRRDRRSYAAPAATPLPIRLSDSGPCVLAVGGHLKNTEALAIDDQAVLSQHVGDLDNLAIIEVHRQAIADLIEFFQCRPPSRGLRTPPRLCLVTNGRTAGSRVGRCHSFPSSPITPTCPPAWRSISQGPVLGFSWAAPLRPDGTVWGGEVLLVLRRPLLARRAPCARFALPWEIVPGANTAFGAGLLNRDPRPGSRRARPIVFRPMRTTQPAHRCSNAGSTHREPAAWVGVRRRCCAFAALPR